MFRWKLKTKAAVFSRNVGRNLTRPFRVCSVGSLMRLTKVRECDGVLHKRMVVVVVVVVVVVLVVGPISTAAMKAYCTLTP
jgi:uncharacterized membrane protein YbjE (DUF340 family)